MVRLGRATGSTNTAVLVLDWTTRSFFASRVCVAAQPPIIEGIRINPAVIIKCRIAAVARMVSPVPSAASALGDQVSKPSHGGAGQVHRSPDRCCIGGR